MGGLFTFSVYAVQTWKDGVERDVIAVQVLSALTEKRIESVATESRVKWAETERRLGSIEAKLDRVLEKRP